MLKVSHKLLLLLEFPQPSGHGDISWKSDSNRHCINKQTEHGLRARYCGTPACPSCSKDDVITARCAMEQQRPRTLDHNVQSDSTLSRAGSNGVRCSDGYLKSQFA